ncbi:MAG: hypothetical protein JF597_30155 [Streptomyces sp.]|uniref:hypothetical protein n=1 Tax=Streptomyces sp. TaxID=1931 RepID=UPI0025D73832|nr:hypothetical protein [Streptomyces sp.]MBW8797692.1 hypothetical protein [Streptomyces sp.]
MGIRRPAPEVAPQALALDQDEGSPHEFDARAVADVPGGAPGEEWLVEAVIRGGPAGR